MTDKTKEAYSLLHAMIQDSVLTPGSKVIYVTYYGVTSYVDLMEDGRLKYEEELFDSPAACSLVIKQKQKKELKFDSGWGSCRLVSSKKSLRELRDTWAGKVTVSAGEKRKSPSEDRVDNARTTRRRTTSEASRPEAVTVEHEAPAVEEPEISPATRQSSRIRATPNETVLVEMVDNPISMNGGRMGPRGCNICKLDTGRDNSIQCGACKSYFHHGCLSTVFNEIWTGPWFCEDCFNKQMESIRPFLISLQETLRSDCVNDADDTASEGEDMHVQAKSELTKRVDALLMQLGSRKHQMDVLASSTGEMLVHLSKMDLPRDFKSIFSLLSADHSNISDLEVPQHCNDKDTPAQVLIRGADVLHRLTKGVCQVQETVKALFERSENTLQKCTNDLSISQAARKDESREMEHIQREIQLLETQVPKQKQNFQMQSELLNSLKLHKHECLQALEKHYLAPAYEEFYRHTLSSQGELLSHAIKSKVEEWIIAIGQASEEKASYMQLIREAKKASNNAFPSQRLCNKQIAFYEARMVDLDERCVSSKKAIEKLQSMAKAKKFPSDLTTFLLQPYSKSNHK